MKIQPKSQTKRTFFAAANNTSPKANTYNSFLDFVEKTNVTNFTNPDLRNEIRGNLNVLINKINDVYDLEKWAQTDTRVNFLLQTNSDDFNNFNNSNGSNFQSNTFNTGNGFYFHTRSDMKKLNETDADKFKTILRQKVNNMSIDKSTKNRLTKNFDKFNDSSSDRFYNPKVTNIIAKQAASDNLDFESVNNKSNNLKNIKKEEKEYININLNLNSTAENKKTKNFIFTTNSNTNDSYNNNTTNNYNNTTTNNINNKNNNSNKNSKTNNSNSISGEIIDINDNFNIGKITLPAVATKYSRVNSDFYVNLTEVEKLKNDNSKLYERFKDSSLYRDFPSPDRKEFVVKKGEKLRTNTKQDKIDRTLLDFSRYNASKHNHVFCEDYDTNQKVLVKFKNSKKVF